MVPAKGMIGERRMRATKTMRNTSRKSSKKKKICYLQQERDLRQLLRKSGFRKRKPRNVKGFVSLSSKGNSWKSKQESSEKKSWSEWKSSVVWRVDLAKSIRRSSSKDS